LTRSKMVLSDHTLVERRNSLAAWLGVDDSKQTGLASKVYTSTTLISLPLLRVLTVSAGFSARVFANPFKINSFNDLQPSPLMRFTVTQHYLAHYKQDLTAMIIPTLAW
jgi:hypothetical protein